MTVTQVFMGTGRWQVNFAERLPQTVRDQILPLDHIVIGPKNLLDTTTTDAERLTVVKAGGGYTGVILEIPDSTSLSGADLSWWLGDAEGRGPMKDTAIVKGSSSTSSWVDEILPSNGITKGTVTAGTPFAGVTTPFATRIELLNYIADQADVEWIMRPDGTVDVGPSTTLFPAPTSSAARVIMRDPGNSEGDIQGVEAVQLERSRDANDVVGRVVVFHSANNVKAQYVTASQTPTGVRWKGFGGATPSRSVAADAPDRKSAEASTIATRVIERISVDQKEAVLTSRTWNVTSEVKPGDRVWVYDYASGLYDTTNQVIYRGEVLAPIQMRVNALTWPIHSEMGVYGRLDGGDTWLDLTPYVAVEEPVVRWDVTISGRKRNWTPVSMGAVTIRKKPGEATAANNQRQGRSLTSDREGTWTPTWTNISAGTGGSAENAGAWEVANGLMTIETSLTLGTGGGAGVTGVPTLTLPTGWELRRNVARIHPYGLARMSVSGVQFYGVVQSGSPTTLEVMLMRADVNNVRERNISATEPGTWAAGDRLVIMVSGIKVQPA